MKANVSYNDFKGTVAADIADNIGSPPYREDLKGIGKYLGLNEERFKIIALSFYGIENFSLSLICVDKVLSDENKEHIVSMPYEEIENGNTIFASLFKRLHIVLHDKNDTIYHEMAVDEEVRFDSFHDLKQ